MARIPSILIFVGPVLLGCAVNAATGRITSPNGRFELHHGHPLYGNAVCELDGADCLLVWTQPSAPPRGEHVFLSNDGQTVALIRSNPVRVWASGKPRGGSDVILLHRRDRPVVGYSLEDLGCEDLPRWSGDPVCGHGVGELRKLTERVTSNGVRIEVETTCGGLFTLNLKDGALTRRAGPAVAADGASPASADID